jgi:ceramide glucosyltransferase
MLSQFYLAAQIFLFMVSAGGIAYYLIAIAAARRLVKALAAPSSPPAAWPPFSLLKPLGGAEGGLESYLESFFCRDYPSYEIIFAMRHQTDPAMSIVRHLMARYPQIPTRLILTGEPPYANAKVCSTEKMAEAAQHEILVITHSDASVSPGYLRNLAVTFASPEAGAVANLYRGVVGEEFWSKLEVLGLSTEFMAGRIVADHLD